MCSKRTFESKTERLHRKNMLEILIQFRDYILSNKLIFEME